MPEYAGILIVVGFIIIVVLCVIADKKSSQKFQKKFDEEHEIIDAYGNFMISSRGEFIYNLPSGTLKGYKVWNLNDISTISFEFLKPGRRTLFSVDGPDGKAMKGEYLTPSRKPLKEYGFKNFDIRNGEEKEAIMDLFKRNAGHITFRENGKEI